MEPLDNYFYNKTHRQILISEKTYKEERPILFSKLYRSNKVIISAAGSFVYVYLGQSKCHLKVLVHTSDDPIFYSIGITKYFWKYPNTKDEIYKI